MAYTTNLYNLTCTPEVPAEDLELMLAPENRPPRMRAMAREDVLADPTMSRELILDMIDEGLTPLQDREAELRVEVEEVSYRRALDAASWVI